MRRLREQTIIDFRAFVPGLVDGRASEAVLQKCVLTRIIRLIAWHASSLPMSVWRLVIVSTFIDIIPSHIVW